MVRNNLIARSIEPEMDGAIAEAMSLVAESSFHYGMLDDAARLREALRRVGLKVVRVAVDTKQQHANINT